MVSSRSETGRPTNAAKVTTLSTRCPWSVPLRLRARADLEGGQIPLAERVDCTA